jgi:ferredoxin-NADP reductase
MAEWEVPYIEDIGRAEGTKSFRFERPPDLNYIPGQYFFISIPKEGRKLIHHFSFSSSPTDSFIEFTTRVRESEFKQTMDRLPHGTKVQIREIHGDFILDEKRKMVLFLCGGIGITPAWSMIRWVAAKKADFDMVLIYANRNKVSTAFSDELKELSGPRLKVFHILSKPEDDWKGAVGHVDANFIGSSVPDWKDRFFYVSGPPAFNEAIKKVVLDDLKISKANLKLENFLGY